MQTDFFVLNALCYGTLEIVGVIIIMISILSELTQASNVCSIHLRAFQDAYINILINVPPALQP